MSYSIHLIDDKGCGAYLQVKGRTEWKTKRTALKHLADIKAVIGKGKFGNIVTADLVNEFDEIVK